MPIKSLLLAYLLLLTFSANSQQIKSEKPLKWFYVQPKFQIGLPIIYSDSLTSSIKKTYFSEELKIGFQTQGTHPSQYYLHFPTFGFGIYSAQLNNPDTLGNPFAVYSFYNSPFINNPKFRCSWELGIGLAWHFKVFDFETNPKNDLISSKLNVIFNLNLAAAYKISERLDAVADINFSHFSNGSMKMPNKGLNLYAMGVGVKYHFWNSPSNFQRFNSSLKNKPIDYKKHKQIDVFWAAGIKATRRDMHSEPKYLCSSLAVDYGKAYHHVGVFSGGLDLFYDASLRESVADPDNTSEFHYMMLGAHFSHELRVSDFSLLTQFGTYLQKTMDEKGNFFLRVGIRYTLPNQLFLNVSLKTLNGFKADFVEFGLGYRFIKI